MSEETKEPDSTKPPETVNDSHTPHDAPHEHDLDAPQQSPPSPDEPLSSPGLAGRRPGKRLVKRDEVVRRKHTAEERLHLLDVWSRSGLPATEFGPLVNVSAQTLGDWRQRFAEHGPAGLVDKPRQTRAARRISELTKRAILLLKREQPNFGCERISFLLERHQALAASPATVAKVLHEAGYELEEKPTRPHEPPVHRFERAKPNQLWQTDLFTFVLKRQNRRVYLVGFLDDNSRFIVGYGLHATQATALVLETFRASVATFGRPEEVLTDNGSQYVTWRGKSAFARECEKHGIKQIVASPRRPRTLGKIERFWGSLWRECLEGAVFFDITDARRRIGLFIDYYNFMRPHSGIEGLVPADRFFGAAPEVRKALEARVAKNALELARDGIPKAPFYLTGQVGGRPFSVHAEGERLILVPPEGERKEIDLVPPPANGAASEQTQTLPEAVCPDGSPASDLPEPAVSGDVPGASAVDELLSVTEYLALGAIDRVVARNSTDEAAVARIREVLAHVPGPRLDETLLSLAQKGYLTLVPSSATTDEEKQLCLVGSDGVFSAVKLTAKAQRDPGAP